MSCALRKVVLLLVLAGWTYSFFFMGMEYGIYRMEEPIHECKKVVMHLQVATENLCKFLGIDCPVGLQPGQSKPVREIASQPKLVAGEARLRRLPNAQLVYRFSPEELKTNAPKKF